MWVCLVQRAMKAIRHAYEIEREKKGDGFGFGFVYCLSSQPWLALFNYNKHGKAERKELVQ